MATYLYQCQRCGTVGEVRVPNMNPPGFTCPRCVVPTQRIYTAPQVSVHQTGADWLNEVANGYGDPPAGMTREQGMAAAKAKARSDKQMAHQSGKAHKTISLPGNTAAHPLFAD